MVTTGDDRFHRMAKKSTSSQFDFLHVRICNVQFPGSLDETVSIAENSRGDTETGALAERME